VLTVGTVKIGPVCGSAERSQCLPVVAQFHLYQLAVNLILPLCTLGHSA
jgi:hypothetical protein